MQSSHRFYMNVWVLWERKDGGGGRGGRRGKLDAHRRAGRSIEEKQEEKSKTVRYGDEEEVMKEEAKETKEKETTGTTRRQRVGR